MWRANWPNGPASTRPTRSCCRWPGVLPRPAGSTASVLRPSPSSAVRRAGHYLARVRWLLRRLCNCSADSAPARGPLSVSDDLFARMKTKKEQALRVQSEHPRARRGYWFRAETSPCPQSRAALSVRSIETRRAPSSPRDPRRPSGMQGPCRASRVRSERGSRPRTR